MGISPVATAPDDSVLIPATTLPSVVDVPEDNLLLLSDLLRLPRMLVRCRRDVLLLPRPFRPLRPLNLRGP